MIWYNYNLRYKLHILMGFNLYICNILSNIIKILFHDYNKFSPIIYIQLRFFKKFHIFLSFNTLYNVEIINITLKKRG